MRKLVGCLLLVVAVAVISQPALADPPAKEKIRVLLTVGGHAFEEAPFYAMWDAMPGIQWTKIDLPQQGDLLKPGLEKQYDVIAMYDMCPGLKPEQQQAFAELLKKGIGVVAMHHNLGGYQKWDEYRKIIGGKFCVTDCEFDGVKHKQSTWDHDQEVKIDIVDNEHPITKGIEPFTIHDEVYGGYWVSPDAKILLTTDHPKNKPGQIAWVTKYGNSPVAYLMLGHDSQAWKNPSYPKLLRQAIQWAACR